VFDNLLPTSLASFPATPGLQVEAYASCIDHAAGGKGGAFGGKPPLFTDAGYPLLASIVPGSQSVHNTVPP